MSENLNKKINKNMGLNKLIVLFDCVIIFIIGILLIFKNNFHYLNILYCLLIINAFYNLFIDIKNIDFYLNVFLKKSSRQIEKNEIGFNKYIIRTIVSVIIFIAINFYFNGIINLDTDFFVLLYGLILIFNLIEIALIIMPLNFKEFFGLRYFCLF